MLAVDYKKRVMIVDTSNEIGGDGDIPHPGIGNARRLQVPKQDMQHKVCNCRPCSVIHTHLTLMYTQIYSCRM
jgi:hypothetical protein